MEITFAAFVSAAIAHPIVIIILLIAVGSTLVNGATDAPNAIATVVGTRCMTPDRAILMAASCNFLGLAGISTVSVAVAHTILNMVDLGGNSDAALLAVCAGAVSIIVWGLFSWYFGLPTSNSHALCAGITGAGIAITGFGGVNMHEWSLILIGLLVSTGLGFGLGWLSARLTNLAFKNANRKQVQGGFKYAQIATGAAVALLHGAQDGQKFLSLAMMGILLALGESVDPMPHMPIWLIGLIAISMGLGTAFGGKRIIKTVGMSLVKLETHQGCVASLAAAACIALATFTGMPVSTTHTATTAIMGVGAERNIKSVNWSITGNMVASWVLTFPACGILGFAITKLFLLF